MPEFGSPFSCLSNDGKLKDEELVRAIRFMVAAEYEAIQLYMQLAGSTDNKLAVKVLKDIADKEFFSGRRNKKPESSRRSCTRNIWKRRKTPWQTAL